MSRLRVANRWFERRSLADGVTLLWEPYVHALLRCNIWHVRGGERDLLVDTGLGVASLRAELADLVDKPLTAVATHVHYDHVGSFHEFDTRLMHQAESAQMADYREAQPLRADGFPSELWDLLVADGMPAGDGLLLTALPEERWDPEDYAVRSARPTGELAEGDRVDLGDRSFEVLHLPGHSPGSLGLYEHESGVLFSGDAVYDGFLFDMLPESDIPAYVETMKRLRELPVSVVHGGHEASFGRDRLREIADCYLTAHDRG